MNIKQEIKKSIDNTIRINKSRSAKHKGNMLTTLEQNLTTNKQTIEQNQPLVDKIKAVTPAGLTQIQLALLDAMQGAK